MWLVVYGVHMFMYPLVQNVVGCIRCTYVHVSTGAKCGWLYTVYICSCIHWCKMWLVVYGVHMFMYPLVQNVVGCIRCTYVHVSTGAKCGWLYTVYICSCIHWCKMWLVVYGVHMFMYPLVQNVVGCIRCTYVHVSTGAKCMHFITTAQHLDNGGVSVFHGNFLDNNAGRCSIAGVAVAVVVNILVGAVSNIPRDVQMS